jgi:hypothetical protein
MKRFKLVSNESAGLFKCQLVSSEGLQFPLHHCAQTMQDSTHFQLSKHVASVLAITGS